MKMENILLYYATSLLHFTIYPRLYKENPFWDLEKLSHCTSTLSKESYEQKVNVSTCFKIHLFGKTIRNQPI